VADAVLLCQQRHMVARLQCVEFLGSHEEFFAPFIEYDDKIKTFEQYLAEMSKVIMNSFADFVLFGR